MPGLYRKLLGKAPPRQPEDHVSGLSNVYLLLVRRGARQYAAVRWQRSYFSNVD